MSRLNRSATYTVRYVNALREGEIPPSVNSRPSLPEVDYLSTSFRFLHLLFDLSGNSVVTYPVWPVPCILVAFNKVNRTSQAWGNSR